MLVVDVLVQEIGQVKTLEHVEKLEHVKTLEHVKKVETEVDFLPSQDELDAHMVDKLYVPPESCTSDSMACPESWYDFVPYWRRGVMLSRIEQEEPANVFKPFEWKIELELDCNMRAQEEHLVDLLEL